MLLLWTCLSSSGPAAAESSLYELLCLVRPYGRGKNIPQAMEICAMVDQELGCSDPAANRENRVGPPILSPQELARGGGKEGVERKQGTPGHSPLADLSTVVCSPGVSIPLQVPRPGVCREPCHHLSRASGGGARTLSPRFAPSRRSFRCVVWCGCKGLSRPGVGRLPSTALAKAKRLFVVLVVAWVPMRGQRRTALLPGVLHLRALVTVDAAWSCARKSCLQWRLGTRAGPDRCTCRRQALEPAAVGVSKIWVHPGVRRKGIARRLLQSVCDHTVYGASVPAERLAFTSPTPAGRELAAAFTGREGESHSRS